MSWFGPVTGRWWRAERPGQTVSGYLEQTGADRRFAHSWRLLLDGDLGDIDPGYETSVTLFGNTACGSMTLRHAVPVSWRNSRSCPGSERTIMQEWQAFTLLSGGHYPSDHRFREASFQVPQAIDWLGPSRLNRYAQPEPLPDEPGESERTLATASLDNGMLLTAWLGHSESLAPLGRRREHEWHCVYSLSHQEGFTLDEAADVAHAVARLQSLAFGVRMDSHELTFTEDRTPRGHRWVKVLNPTPPAGLDWTGLCPFFDTSEIDFESMVKSWLKLREDVPLVDSAIELRPGHSTVQHQLLVHCSALESIAHRRWPAPEPTESDKEIIEALRLGAIKSKRRKMVANQLKQRRWPLETKLAAAAATLGAESSRHLLGDVPAWAHLVMRLRNSWAHGLRLPTDLGDDVEIMIEAQRSVANVLRLTILKELGYTNNLGSKNGELLWSETGAVASHINSDLFRELESLSSRSQQWAQWRSRLQ